MCGQVNIELYLLILTVGRPHWLYDLHVNHEEHCTHDDSCQAAPRDEEEVGCEQADRQQNQGTCNTAQYQSSCSVHTLRKVVCLYV